MSHFAKCLALMHRYQGQGRSSASIGLMLRSVGARRYLVWDDSMAEADTIDVWCLRGYVKNG